MNNLKTYEGFLDVFKKSQKPSDICAGLIDFLKQKYTDSSRWNIKPENFGENVSKVTYRITLIKSGSRLMPTGGELFLQDVFNIEIKKDKKNLICKIKIERDHNCDMKRGILISWKRLNIETFEKLININPVEKLPKIVDQIHSEISKHYELLKNSTKEESEKIINYIKNKDKVDVENTQNRLKKELQFKKDKEEYKQSLLKDFDVDNVESIALDLKDDFHDVNFETIEDSGKIYFEISGGGHLTAKDPYNLGLETRISCNDFIKRYKSEYGDDYKISVDFINNRFYIRFELGEYPKSFGSQSRFNPISGEMDYVNVNRSSHDDNDNNDNNNNDNNNNDNNIDTNDNYDLDDDNTD